MSKLTIAARIAMERDANKLLAIEMILDGILVTSDQVIALGTNTHHLSRMPKRYKDCAECEGTGDGKSDPSIPCESCGGKGFVPIRRGRGKKDAQTPTGNEKDGE